MNPHIHTPNSSNKNLIKKNTDRIHTPEKYVQNACLEYLRFKKHFFFRLNNIPVFNNGKFRKLSEYTPRGLPDAVLVKEGRFIGLEFKGTRGKLSADQEMMRNEINQAGGKYYVITCIEDLREIGL